MIFFFFIFNLLFLQQEFSNFYPVLEKNREMKSETMFTAENTKRKWRSFEMF